MTKKCEESFAKDAEEILKEQHRANIVSQSQSKESDKSLITLEEKQAEEKLMKFGSSMTPRMLEVLSKLAEHDGDLQTLINKKIITKVTIGHWVETNPAFRSYWNDICNKIVSSVKLDAALGVAKSVELVSQKLPNSTINQAIAAGKYFKDILKIDEVRDKPTGKAEESTTTTYNEDGKIMSVTEQRRFITSIREKNREYNENT